MVRGYARSKSSLAFPDSGRRDADINGGLSHGMWGAGDSPAVRRKIGIQNGVFAATRAIGHLRSAVLLPVDAFGAQSVEGSKSCQANSDLGSQIVEALIVEALLLGRRTTVRGLS